MMENLKKQFQAISQKYIQAFEKKQGMHFEFWVADRVGEIACFGDIFISLSDIRYDIDTDQPKGKILKWYDYRLEDNDSSINYYNYCKWNI